MPAAALQGRVAGATPLAGHWLQRLLLPSLLSMTLLYLGFFPVNWGWLGWVALVPLLWVVTRPPTARSESEPLSRWRRLWSVVGTRGPRGLLWALWLSGLAFMLVALQWLRVASAPMYGVWLVVGLVVALHFPLFAIATRWLVFRTRLPLLLAAPAAWVALEYLRAVVWIGFPWYYLAHTQHDSSVP